MCFQDYGAELGACQINTDGALVIVLVWSEALVYFLELKSGYDLRVWNGYLFTYPLQNNRVVDIGCRKFDRSGTVVDV